MQEYYFVLRCCDVCTKVRLFFPQDEWALRHLLKCVKKTKMIISVFNELTTLNLNETSKYTEALYPSYIMQIRFNFFGNRYLTNTIWFLLLRWKKVCKQKVFRCYWAKRKDSSMETILIVFYPVMTWRHSRSTTSTTKVDGQGYLRYYFVGWYYLYCYRH